MGANELLDAAAGRAADVVVVLGVLELSRSKRPELPPFAADDAAGDGWIGAEVMVGAEGAV